MSFERITLPGVSDEENNIANALLQVLEHRQERNLLRAAYYDGKRAIKQVGTIIPPQYYNLGIVLGWSAKAVDLLARRCNLDSFVWPDGDLNSIGFREVWEGNMLGAEVSSGLVESLIHGPAFVINTKGAAGEPPALIHFKNALNATGTWNPRRRTLDNLLSIIARDSESGRPTEFVLYLDGVTITAQKDGSGWSTDRQEHSWGVPAEALVYKPRVGRPFGMSRISRAIMSLHDQGLRAVIRLEAHSDIYAIPDLWMFGADESIFKNADGSQKASWQIVMGRLKGIPDNDEAPDALARAQVQQIPASSPEPQLSRLNAAAKMFAREASLPDTAVAVTDMANPTSAEAYDASQHELIAEAEGAAADWTPPLRRALVRGLAMANDLTSVPPEWATIDAKWRDPRYQSRAAQADAGSKILPLIAQAQSDVELELLGLSEQQIQRIMAAKRRNQGSGVLQALQEAAARQGAVSGGAAGA